MIVLIETCFAFYVDSGLFTYIIITDAVNEKLEKEEMMREEWLRNRTVTVKHANKVMVKCIRYYHNH